MKAIEIFESMGYILIRNDDDYISYEKKVNEDMNKIVMFGSQLESMNVFYESETIQITDIPSIGLDLNEAIQVQLRELDWI